MKLNREPPEHFNIFLLVDQKVTLLGVIVAAMCLLFGAQNQ